MSDEVREYEPLPTLREFHEHPAQIRCIVGPVGSGKTTAATWEICYYLPQFLFDEYKITKTRWVIVRNTYSELIDTTQKTVFDWFSWGHYEAQRKTLTLSYPEGFEAEIMFRSCDRPDDVKKFKSLEITGYWIDESIEVPDEVKMMLKNRIGRFPRQSPVRFGIETTNPPDIESSTYRDFAWTTPPPGPVPEGTPKANHVGFWQPPRENDPHLRPHYYDDLMNDYSDNPDWADMYVMGKPGVLVRGKLVYHNFQRARHVAAESLIWSQGPLYRGWDNSGNCPACVVAQMPTAGQVHILREFTTDKMGIVDFTRHAVMTCNMAYPNATYQDWGDPAGANKFSKMDGGFTSNAQLMLEAAGVNVVSSDQNMTARIQSVDQALGRFAGLLIDPSCTRLINGFLGGYCYPEIGNSGEHSDKPDKNRFSHIHDALQYLMLKLLTSSRSVTSFTPNRSSVRRVNAKVRRR
jgi:phage terminase large subunit